MFILGKKMNMTQIWKEVEVRVAKEKKVETVKVLRVIPVTIIEAKPNKVALVRTKDRDGYEAVQVALGKKKKEFRTDRPSSPKQKDGQSLNQGDMIAVDAFAEGDKVQVSGVMKGRGFQGVVKRHGFAGGPKTRGQKNRFRAPGSIGSTAFQRVVPGRRMAGHMGAERVTVKNLTVAAIDKEKNLIFLKGAVPGARGGMIEIKKL